VVVGGWMGGESCFALIGSGLVMLYIAIHAFGMQ
jgi:hypothetical protein